MPEREQRLLRIVRHVRLLRQHRVHRGWQLERQLGSRREAAEDHVEHRAIARAEVGQERRALLGDLRDHRRAVEMDDHDGWDAREDAEDTRFLALSLI